MNEENRLKIIKLIKELKININPSINNEKYQIWVKHSRDQKGSKLPFRKFIISQFEQNLFNILDYEEEKQNE